MRYATENEIRYAQWLIKGGRILHADEVSRGRISPAWLIFEWRAKRMGRYCNMKQENEIGTRNKDICM